MRLLPFIVRSGLLGWVLIVMSADFVLTKSLLPTDAPSNGENSRSYLNVDSSLSSTKRLRWIRDTKMTLNDSQTAENFTYNLDAVELARHYGYQCERHKVTTEDGYILEVHRLPYGKGVPEDGTKVYATTPRPAVIIHHAFLTSSREFLILGPKKGLAFFLADAGFDVWLCNARGNTYSKNHTFLKPSQKEFWNFSFHEHGTQDLPATINYALKVNGGRKLHYIGYSMGTTAFFVMASERPNLLDKVKTFTGLGPVRTNALCRSILLQLALRTANITERSFNSLGMYDFLSHSAWMTSLGQTLCANRLRTQQICVDLFLSQLGGKSTTMNRKLLPEIVAHTPSGTSLKTLVHFAQGFRTGEFRKFDYGKKKNLERYQSKIPPFYNIEAVNVPVQLYYSINDLMADFKEALALCKILPNVFACEKVPDDTFTHLDFMWSEAAHILVYPKVLEGIKKFENIGNKP